MHLVGPGVLPSVIQLPSELGGRIERVQQSFKGNCPCGSGTQVQHWRLETVAVAECQGCKFLWYRITPP